MMERTALGSRSNCAAQAWPGQATGAALPNRSSRRKSQARSHSPNTVIGHCTHPDPTKHPTRSSLLATSDPRPRSGRQSIPIGHALGNGLVQPIFRPPSRRSPSDCSPSVFRRDAGLKMLCITDQMLKRRLKQAGLPPHYSPHSFRATGITNFWKMTAPLKPLRELAAVRRFCSKIWSGFGINFELRREGTKCCETNYLSMASRLLV